MMLLSNFKTFLDTAQRIMRTQISSITADYAWRHCSLHHAHQSTSISSRPSASSNVCAGSRAVRRGWQYSKASVSFAHQSISIGTGPTMSCGIWTETLSDLRVPLSIWRKLGLRSTLCRCVGLSFCTWQSSSLDAHLSCDLFISTNVSKTAWNPMTSGVLFLRLDEKVTAFKQQTKDKNKASDAQRALRIKPSEIWKR